MMKKKVRSIAAAMIVALALTGCGRESVKVPVMQVSMLASASQNSEKFAGVVVSENAIQIPRDLEKSIKELHVSVGDEVRAGEKLFSYDSDELSLMLDRQDLDLERLKAGIEEKEKQIEEVEKELKNASGDNETALNIQLRQLKADLTQSKYDQEVKKTEIEYTRKMLENVDVYSPIDGTVRKIEDSSAEAYMVIQQSGAYRVQGTLNELSLNAGIREGTEVTVISRLDPAQMWTGVVSHVDYNSNLNGSEGSANGMIGGMGGMMGGDTPATTSYPFYITLDSTDGLLLGQHVYIQIGAAAATDGRVLVPISYLSDIVTDETTFQTTATVLTPDASGKLVRRTVTLGAYELDYDSYEVTQGLTAEDYIADPSNPDSTEGAMTDQRAVSDYEQNAETVPAESETGDGFAAEERLPAEETEG